MICHCYGNIFSYIYQALKQLVSCGQSFLFSSKEFGVESGMLVFGNKSLVKYMVQMVLKKLVVYNMIGVRVEAKKSWAMWRWKKVN